MPIEKGRSKAVRDRNIREMVESGHPVAQAAAAAYRQQRKSKGSDKHSAVVQKSLDGLKARGRI